MGFPAKIPLHTYKKYFDTTFDNILNLKDTHVIKINVRFVAINNDYERIYLKWYCSTFKTGGEFSEEQYKNFIAINIQTWINWNTRSSFGKIDFL